MKTWKSEVLDWIKSVALALAFVALIFVFARPAFIIGDSMLPSFKNNQVVVNERISLLRHSLQVGDVVTFKSDLQLFGPIKKNLIKRVKGLPGDHVHIENGQLLINDKLEQESSIVPLDPTDYFDGIVPSGHLFVLGDNRVNSSDSRNLGFIDQDRVMGRVYFSLWPFRPLQ